MNDTAHTTDHWRELKEELIDRLRKPTRHPTFVMYFLVIIVVIGGFGICETLVRHYLMNLLPEEEFEKALLSAFYTYFTAIAATAAVDVILSSQNPKFLLMFFLLISVVVFVLALFALLTSSFSVALILVLFGYVLALFLWWIGNAENRNLSDTQPPVNASTGGSIATPPAGNLTGFKQ
jgi:Na+/melibiose symporter-like transporter